MQTIDNIEEFKSGWAALINFAGIMVITYAIWWSFQNNMPWTTKEEFFFIGIALCPIAEIVKRIHVPQLYKQYLAKLDISELRQNRDLDTVSIKSKDYIIASIEQKIEMEAEA